MEGEGREEKKESKEQKFVKLEQRREESEVGMVIFGYFCLSEM